MDRSVLVLLVLILVQGEVQGEAYDAGDCPKSCHCEHLSKVHVKDVKFTVINGMLIYGCSSDPFTDLARMIRKYPTIDSLQLTNIGRADKSGYKTKVPTDIGILTYLKVLNISYNQLTELPDSIGNMSVLEWLDLSHNQITELPAAVGQLESLLWLDVSNNKLTELPTAIWQLPKLLSLYSTYNQISTLSTTPMTEPNFISRLTNSRENPSLPNTTHKVMLKVDLSHNDFPYLHHISEGLNITQEKLVYLLINDHLNLGNNPLRCDCIDYTIYKELNHQALPLLCGAPKHLSVYQITEVGLDKFVCNITKRCPAGCTCKYIPNQGILRVDSHSYNGTSLPQYLPRPPNIKMANISDFKYDLNFDNGHLVSLEKRHYLKQVRNASFRHNYIKGIKAEFFKMLKSFSIINLENNDIERLPSCIVTRPEFEIHLSHNEWECSCNNDMTIRWIQENNDKVLDYDNVTCHGKTSTFDKVVDTLCSTQSDELSPINLALIVVSVTFAVALLIILFVYIKRVWVYKTFKFHPFERIEANDEEKEFDVFVSYSDYDSGYVEQHLIPRLEELGFGLCHHREHFLAGETIVWNIHRAITKSKRTLAFYSNSYQASGTCMHEFYTALTLQMQGGGYHLVTIKDTDIDVNTLEIDMQSYFKHYTYVERESYVFWENLMYVLPINRMNASARENGNNRRENMNESERVVIDNNAEGNMNDIEMVVIDNNGQRNMNEAEMAVVDNNGQGNMNDIEMVALVDNGQRNMNDIEVVAIVHNAEGDMN